MGGGGAFSTPITFPPTTDAWTRGAGNPIISANEAWDENAVVEPCVLYDGSTFKMWYRGGWTTTSIGYATCTGDPTVGANWTKGSNPIIGQGAASFGGNAQQPWVTKDGSTYYVQVTGGDGNLWTATSATGISGFSGWTQGLTLPAGVTRWGNHCSWNEGGSTWKMLLEGLLTGAGVWRIWYCTGTDGLTWTLTSAGDGSLGEYTTLLVGGIGGATGAPRIASVNGVTTPTYGGSTHVWYHGVNGLGNLPTDLYHASTSDITVDAWTISPATPVLTHLGSGFEIDQVAGPCPLVVGQTSYVFYDGDDNTLETAGIGVATG